MREMTKDYAASLELMRCYERNQWTGSLGEKREAHRRPGWFSRKLKALRKLIVPVRGGK